VVRDVAFPEQLFAHDGEYEDDDGQHEAEVAESAHRSPDDADQKVQCRPRLGQLEHTQLRRKQPDGAVGKTSDSEPSRAEAQMRDL